MSDPSGLTMAGKIDVLLLLGKGQSRNNRETKSYYQTPLLGALSTLGHRSEASQTHKYELFYSKAEKINPFLEKFFFLF